MQNLNHRSVLFVGNPSNFTQVTSKRKNDAKYTNIHHLELLTANDLRDKVLTRRFSIREPTNDHEHAIVEAIDDKFRKDPASTYESVVVDIAMSLSFLLSASDAKFLIRYCRWRSAHPEVPPNSE